MKKFTLATLVALILLYAHAADFNTISNFGDSLSDIGNKHMITVDMSNKTSGKIGIRALNHIPTATSVMVLSGPNI
ncbi:hypothetical protein [Photobacterium kishitanii]|uniref:hypothetical protein n=1 Tax=Photobacterium kishitanii TaxID=318456 RepID=UPI0027399D29|nr:hypothetical protein [Photobacterium kishitanii]